MMHKLMKTESDPVAVATAAPAVTPLGKRLVETVCFLFDFIQFSSSISCHARSSFCKSPPVRLTALH